MEEPGRDQWHNTLRMIGRQQWGMWMRLSAAVTGTPEWYWTKACRGGIVCRGSQPRMSVKAQCYQEQQCQWGRGNDRFALAENVMGREVGKTSSTTLVGDMPFAQGPLAYCLVCCPLRWDTCERMVDETLIVSVKSIDMQNSPRCITSNNLGTVAINSISSFTREPDSVTLAYNLPHPAPNSVRIVFYGFQFHY